jgi:branched-chain amino acid transport system ATP-binding protein
MLKVSNLTVGYGDVQILYGVDFEVNEGEVVCLLGSNGVGKTTTLRAVSGILPAWSGSVEWRGRRLEQLSSDEIVERGVVQVPEGRRLFPNLTVLENLELGAYSYRSRSTRVETLRQVFDLFPRLEERQGQFAGTLSGGEQQMVAIGRGLMAKPDILMLDEPSLGLAPVIVQDIFRVIKELAKQGLTILLVEQNLVQALKIAARGYVIDQGRIMLQGTGDELLQNDHTRQAYLGL